jgi:cyclic beta-1,2-glucan synthetase
VRRDAGLIKPPNPPVDRSTLDPGYIRGYAPGVRENGGHYTHAAVWVAMAFAAIGDRERAWELEAMLNPASRTQTPEGMAVYGVEPYAVTADIYSHGSNAGRGGWTWYTGSAGWLYRLIVESLLGFAREHDRLRFAPCLPAGWDGFTMRYTFGATVYEIRVRQAHGVPGEQATRVTVDGTLSADGSVALVDDGARHDVVVDVIACSPGEARTAA